jgi:hypothetical protein
MTRAARRLALLASLATFPISAAARADDRPRVLIEKVRGAIAFSIENPLKNTLKAKKEIRLVSPEEAKKSVHAVIEAKTTREGPAWVATIEVKEGATGVTKKTWRLKTKEIRKLSGAIEKKAWKELGPAILASKPGPYGGGAGAVAAGGGAAKEEQPSAEASPEPKSEPRADAKKPWEPAAGASASSAGSSEGGSSASSSGAGTSEAAAVRTEVTPAGKARPHNQTPLEMALAFDYVTRSFKYNDDLFGRLHPYSLNGAPALRIGATWYPAGHFTAGFASNLGLDLGLEYVFGITSKNKDGATFPTKSLELGGALRGRIPLGDHEIALFAGGGRHTFDIGADSSGNSPGVPSVGYTYLRLGAEARFVLFPHFSARASLAWRRVLKKGDIQSDAWFPGASAVGVDALLGAGYEVIDGLEVQLAFIGRRYAFSFNPIPGDKNVAGGALDQYLAGTVGVAYALGR